MPWLAASLISLILAWMPLAYAQDASCEAIPDVRGKHPKLAEFFSTPRDQDSSWWCAMFMVADLLTFKTEKPVSAVDLAVLFNSEEFENKSFLDKYLFSENKISQKNSGNMDALLKVAQKHGVCSEADMPSNSNAFADEAHSIVRAIQQIELLQRRIKRGNLTLSRFLKDPNCMGTIQKFLPGVDASQFYQLISSAHFWEQLDTTFFKLDQLNCKNKRIRLPDGLKSSFLDSLKTDKKELIESLEKSLKRGDPLAAAFPYQRVGSGKEASSHGALILAQEMRNGECKVLMRNSWGPGCQYYQVPVMRDCNAKEGTFWVSRDELLKPPTQLQFIE